MSSLLERCTSVRSTLMMSNVRVLVRYNPGLGLSARPLEGRVLSAGKSALSCPAPENESSKRVGERRRRVKISKTRESSELCPDI